MLERVESSNGEEGWKSGRGELRIVHPAPGLVVFRETGFLTADFAEHVERHSNQAAERASKIQIFVDAYDLVGYDPEIRNSATSWLKAHMDVVDAQHMLVNSRLTKMGLTVASLALGGVIKGYHTRQPFENELAAAIRRARP